MGLLGKLAGISYLVVGVYNLTLVSHDMKLNLSRNIGDMLVTDILSDLVKLEVRWWCGIM